MKRSAERLGTLCALSALCLVAVPRLAAQDTAAAPAAPANTTPADNTQPAAQPAPAATTPATPTPAQVAVSAENPAQSPVVKLSPFTVDSTSGEDTYKVNDTLAGTRVRTNLNDIGAAISVVSSKFMSDIGATSAESLLQYTTNTEVGGVYGNFGGMGATAQLDETANLLNPNQATRVRGLTSADNTTNYFLTSIPWDGYNVGRVDMSRGPNSILFGVGSPAGIINTGLNEAAFDNSGKFENRIGQYGSLRNVLDINRVLLANELAIRVTGLNDNEEFQQSPAFNHQKRIFGSLRYDPSFLNKGSAHTSITIDFESGKVSSNNPRTLPPIDAITPWFSALNKGTYDLTQVWRIGGVAQTGPNFNPWFNEAFLGSEIYNAPAYTYNANSPAPTSVMSQNPTEIFGINTSGQVVGGISGMPFIRPLGIATYNSYSQASTLPGAQYNVYVDKSLTDPSIFDFYNKLLDGPNKHEWQNWNQFNLDASQTFLDGRLGLDGAYHHEHFVEGQESFLDGENYVISVDVNQNLANGAPNPNVGRPYVGNSGLSGNNANITDRDSYRAQGFAELRATDFLQKSWLTDFLGHQIFNGLFSQDTVNQTAYSWNRWATGQDWSTATGQSANLSTGLREVNWIDYLGPNLWNASSPTGANLSAVTVVQQPSPVANLLYFDSHWAPSLIPGAPGYVNPAAPFTQSINTQPISYNPASDGGAALQSTQSANPANYVGWVTQPFSILSADNGDISQLYTNGAKSMSKVRSEALTWQGFFLDGVIVPTYGWRRDTVSLASASAPIIDQNTDVIDPFNYTAGAVQSKQTATSNSWSIVLHAPKFIKDKLPAGMDFSIFYDRGENFQAESIRKDVNGDTIPDATGKTKEYGFVVSALDNKVSLKVNWYQTTVKDATLAGADAGIGGNLYYLYLLPVWAAGTAAIDYAGVVGGANYAINGGKPYSGMPWYWDYSNNDNGTPYGQSGTITPAQQALINTSNAAEVAMISDFQKYMPSQQFFDTYKIPFNVAAAQSGNWANAFPGGWNPVASSGPGSLESATGGTIGGIAPSATVDTVSKGIEFELYAQPFKNWNLTVNVAKTMATEENLNAALVTVIDQQKQLWDSNAGLLRLWYAGGNTMRSYFMQNIYGPYLNLVAQSGSSASEIRPWHANFITSYYFDHGMLKGWSVGGADRWQQGQILGYALNPTTEFIDVTKPYRGASENSVDLWLGYEHKLTAKIAWSIQLNLKNVGQKARLIPISVEPDGSAGAFRIADGQLWQLTNTFKF